MASNFLKRKEIIFWSLVTTGVAFFFFIPSVQALTINEIVPHNASLLNLASVFALILVFTTTAYFSESSRTNALEKEKVARDAANRSSNMASLGEMAGGIAHEINNPLMIISGSSSVIERLILKEQVDKEKIIKHLHKIQETSQRASKIIKGLKTLARDGMADPKETVTLKEVIDDVFSIIKTKLNHKEVTLHFDAENKNLDRSLMLYRVQFSQVLLNLISNSFDALMELDERWIKIEVTEDGNGLKLAFIDSGPGIPPEVEAKIFTPFFTTKPVGKGTGLGLPLSYAIVDKCGGKFYYDRSKGNTCFVIELPRELYSSNPPQDHRQQKSA